MSFFFLFSETFFIFRFRIRTRCPSVFFLVEGFFSRLLRRFFFPLLFFVSVEGRFRRPSLTRALVAHVFVRAGLAAFPARSHESDLTT